MPIGIITNVGAIFLGGIVGALSGEHMSDEFKTGLNMAFSICSICMGIYAIAPLKNLAAVIFAVIIGTSLGILLHLGQAINRGAQGMQHFISRFITGPSHLDQKLFETTLVTIIVLFCASGLLDCGSPVCYPHDYFLVSPIYCPPNHTRYDP